MEASTCALCHNHLSRPFTFVFFAAKARNTTDTVYSPGCGHVFCALCLCQQFRSTLECRLAPITFLFFHNPYHHNLHQAPARQDSLKELVRAIRTEGLNPQDFFIYECPSCQYLVTKPPREVTAMTALLKDIENSGDIQAQHSEAEVDEADANGIHYFAGLFLNANPFLWLHYT